MARAIRSGLWLLVQDRDQPADVSMIIAAAILVVADDGVRRACVKQRQGGAVPADFHDVFDKTLDGLFLALFPRQALAKRVYDGLSERLTGSAALPPELAGRLRGP